jgi:hypothetical protein
MAALSGSHLKPPALPGDTYWGDSKIACSTKNADARGLQGVLTQAMQGLSSSQRNAAGRDATAFDCHGILESLH